MDRAENLKGHYPDITEHKNIITRWIEAGVSQYKFCDIWLTILNQVSADLLGDEFLLQRSLMGNESKWATETHIYAMAQVLRKDIIVHVDPPYGVGYEIFEFQPMEGSVSGRLKDALYLKHKSLHYECILGV